ncbi:hypothetical protein D3C86_1408420 [compost metagenome]
MQLLDGLLGAPAVTGDADGRSHGPGAIDPVVAVEEDLAVGRIQCRLQEVEGLRVGRRVQRRQGEEDGLHAELLDHVLLEVALGTQVDDGVVALLGELREALFGRLRPAQDLVTKLAELLEGVAVDRAGLETIDRMAQLHQARMQIPDPDQRLGSRVEQIALQLRERETLGFGLSRPHGGLLGSLGGFGPRGLDGLARERRDELAL